MKTTSENTTAEEPKVDYFKFVRDNPELGVIGSVEELLVRTRLRRQEIENQQKNKDKS